MTSAKGTETIESCPGCGLRVGPADGPTHPYIGSSPGCWALLSELMANIRPADRPVSQLAGDTYAVQHPGVPERRAIQSVCVHLISLGAALERGWPATKAADLVNRAIAHPDWWRWLDPKPPLGTITVADVFAKVDTPERDATVRAWADDLWATYSPHHGLIMEWVETLLGSGAPNTTGRRR